MTERSFEPETGTYFKSLVMEYLLFLNENHPDELDIDSSSDEPNEIEKITEYTEHDRYGKGHVVTIVRYTSYEDWADQYIFPGSFAEFAVAVSRF